MRAARLGSSVYRAIYSNEAITQKINFRTLAGRKFNLEDESHDHKSSEQVDNKFHQVNRTKKYLQNNEDVVRSRQKSSGGALVKTNDELYVKDDPNQRNRKIKQVPNNKKFKTFRHFDKEENDNFVPKDDPDSFGLLTKTHASFSEKYEHDEGDKKEEEFLSERPLKQLTNGQYSHLIKFHIKKNEIKEALDVLEIRMLQEDRAKPTNYVYNLLIYGCGRVGYTKKAFMLFNDMKKRGLKPTGATYTSLFNACSNSPWKEDGLKRAIGLQNVMTEKNYEPNIANYNVMIKAFGRCGDLLRAFSTIDEMVKRKMKIRVHNFNYLFHGCISDKESGFRHALILWRKMLKLREKPNIYSFNLITRCARECKLGNDQLESDLLRMLQIRAPKSHYHIESSDNVKSDDSALQVVGFTDKTNVTAEIKMPNLISPVPHMGDVVSLNKIVSSEDRFMLIGGIDGVMEEVHRYQVKPDIKLFTLLLDVVPNTLAYDEKVLMFKDQYNVKSDIDFYNRLIKRRCYRFDYDAAKNVMSLIAEESSKLKKKSFWKKKAEIKPDIMTYGSLALACQTKRDAEELINKMMGIGTRPNSEIIGTLLRSAFVSKDFEYIKYVMNTIIEEKIPINHIAKKHLEKYTGIKSMEVINLQKSGKELTKEDEQFIENHKEFMKQYALLLKEVKIDNLDIEEHPWTQYRVNRESSFQKSYEEPYKPRLYKRKSKRITKYIVRM